MLETKTSIFATAPGIAPPQGTKGNICGFYQNYFYSVGNPSETDRGWVCRYLRYTKIFSFLDTL